MKAGRVNIMQLFDKRSSVVLDLALSLFFLTISTLLGTLFYRLDFSDSTIMMSYLLGVLMIAIAFTVWCARSFRSCCLTTSLSILVSPCRYWSRAIPWFFWLCS